MDLSKGTDFKIEPVASDDAKEIIDIFNHYVENSFAAYPESRVPYEFFQLFLNMAQGYPFLVARSPQGRVLGFGMLRPHSPIPALSRSAEFTCFISPESAHQGIGSWMLENLASTARKMGIDSILASISSLNPASLAFHKKMGFVECGRFLRVGKKKGEDFDEVWMQMLL